MCLDMENSHAAVLYTGRKVFSHKAVKTSQNCDIKLCDVAAQKRTKLQIGGGFSCLKDRMLEKFQPIKIATRFYWLNAFLKKLTSILTEKVLNQRITIKNITNCG